MPYRQRARRDCMPSAMPPGSSATAMRTSWSQAEQRHACPRWRWRGFAGCGRSRPRSMRTPRGRPGRLTASAMALSLARALRLSCLRNCNTLSSETQRSMPRWPGMVSRVTRTTSRPLLKTYALLIGAGYAYTVSQGSGALKAMTRALEKAQLKPSDIDYINAHATSTPMGDGIELGAISRLWGSTPVAVSSTKGATGHLLGAAGSLEIVFSVLSIHEGTIPPTANLIHPEVPGSPQIRIVPKSLYILFLMISLTPPPLENSRDEKNTRRSHKLIRVWRHKRIPRAEIHVRFSLKKFLLRLYKRLNLKKSLVISITTASRCCGFRAYCRTCFEGQRARGRRSKRVGAVPGCSPCHHRLQRHRVPLGWA